MCRGWATKKASMRSLQACGLLLLLACMTAPTAAQTLSFPSAIEDGTYIQVDASTSRESLNGNLNTTYGPGQAHYFSYDASAVYPVGGFKVITKPTWTIRPVDSNVSSYEFQFCGGFVEKSALSTLKDLQTTAPSMWNSFYDGICNSRLYMVDMSGNPVTPATRLQRTTVKDMVATAPVPTLSYEQAYVEFPTFIPKEGKMYFMLFVANTTTPLRIEYSVARTTAWVATSPVVLPSPPPKATLPASPPPPAQSGPGNAGRLTHGAANLLLLPAMMLLSLLLLA